MADELLDIYDENNQPTGQQKMKSEAHRDGLWHRTVHIWIYNSSGEVLLQLRAKNKELFPDSWDVSVAGHADAGEGSQPIKAALREISEEIGLEVVLDDLAFYRIRKCSKVYHSLHDKEFNYIYFLKFEDSIDQLKLQQEEVQEIRFLPVAQVETDLKSHPEKYAAHGEYWYEILDEIRKRSAKI